MGRITRAVTIIETEPGGPKFHFRPLTFAAKTVLTGALGRIMDAYHDVSTRIGSDTTPEGLANTIVSGGIRALGFFEGLLGDEERRRQVIETVKSHCTRVADWQVEDESGNLTDISVDQAFELLDFRDFIALTTQLVKPTKVKEAREKNSHSPSPSSTTPKPSEQSSTVPVAGTTPN